MLSYYFNKKIALANGIALSGCTGGILVLAPLMRYLSDEYSWRGAMMISGGMMGNLCVFSALFRMTQDEVISMTGTQPVAMNHAIKSNKNSSEIVNSVKKINGNVDLQSRKRKTILMQKCEKRSNIVCKIIHEVINHSLCDDLFCVILFVWFSTLRIRFILCVQRY